MPASKLLVALAISAAISGCNYSASGSVGSGSSSGSTSSSAGSNEVTLSGLSGVAELAGDKIELKDGSVFVNGVSFGPVPAGALVKYTMNTEGRALFVGAERRSAQK